MGRFSGRVSAVCITVFAVALSLGAVSQAQAQDRIVQVIEAGKVSALTGSVHPLALAANDQGPVASDLQLKGMSLNSSLSPAQKTALAALLKAQQDPTSPKYRQWLTAEQYADQFGLTSADVERVTTWLQSQGFTVDKVAESRNAIWFSGTAALAEAAFHTRIHTYNVNGEAHFANATEVSLPTALAGTVVHVGGLNNFRPRAQLMRPMNASKSGVAPQFTSGLSGDHFLAPGDFAVIYDLNALYTAGFTGTGQTIGVMGQTNIVLADITAFRSAAGLPVNNPTVYLIPTSADPGTSYNDLNEADLDLEWAGGVAQNASIVYVNSGDVISSLQYAISNKINGLQIPILTLSYAGCEASFSTAAIQSLELSLQQANAQGQTVLNSAGDSGAAGCDNSSSTITSATQGLAVEYPASSAYVTGLGGSEFTSDGTAANPSTGSDQYWSTNGSNDLITSAKSYIPEMAWNDTAYEIANSGGLDAGGGGASQLFAKPSWQSGVPGIPSDGVRDVPDVSLSSSNDHDPYLFCTQIVLASSPAGTYSSSCASGFRISDAGYSDDQGLSGVGGTSAAAPAFAGILALIEQKLGVSAGLGNINPTLYTLASNSGTYASAFHDITTGNNQVPCTAGSTGCPSSGSIGYAAGTGYDQVTGLGSVDGNNLAIAFSTVAVKAGTTTTVAASPTTPVVGATVTLTATVSPNTGTSLPTGTVSFTVDGAALASVDLTSGVAAATTTFSTGGSHTVVTAYSGDTNYYASTSTSTISVGSSATAAPTTTTLVASPTALTLYGSITLTATVSSTTAGTVAGTVTFTIGNTTVGTAAVVAGASGTGTATLAVGSATTALGFASGSNTVTATYGGDSSYASSSGTAAITVTSPGLTLAVGNMTVPSAAPGSSGTSTVTVTSTGGYAGTVTLSATASSLNANYAFAASSLAVANGASASTTISIQTVAAAVKKGAQSNSRSGWRPLVAAATTAFSGIFLLGIPGFRKRRWSVLTAFLLLGALSVGLGCGGGGTSGASPAGTYTVTVTAVDSANSAITASTNFTVTIQ